MTRDIGPHSPINQVEWRWKFLNRSLSDLYKIHLWDTLQIRSQVSLKIKGLVPRVVPVERQWSIYGQWPRGKSLGYWEAWASPHSFAPGLMMR